MKNRTQKLQKAADMLLGKVMAALAHSEPPELSSQALKHFSGILKDIKDVQMLRPHADIREQEARIESLKKRFEKEPAAQDITIVIQGGEPQWQS